MPVSVDLSGAMSQGGMVVGRTDPGGAVFLDGMELAVSPSGRFVFGFGRDHGTRAVLELRRRGGAQRRVALQVAGRAYPVQRIDGLAEDKVTPPPPALARIARESARKRAARAPDTPGEWFAESFSWPVRGVVTGVYGSRRILNGKPRRPHDGIDIAAPAGAPVHAPAGGIVRLAEADFYFEGGLIFLDHGGGVVSAFLHLSQIAVEAGARVSQGDVIGRVGASGRASGPHLDWRISWLGPDRKLRALDPALLAGGSPES